MRFYHRDAIAEYWRGEITLRQLRVMVQNLPEDSALNRARNGWTTDQYLLADLVDSSRYGRWEYAQSNGAENPEPERIPRPGQAEAEAAEKNQIRAAHDQIMNRLKGGTNNG